MVQRLGLPVDIAPLQAEQLADAQPQRQRQMIQHAQPMRFDRGQQGQRLLNRQRRDSLALDRRQLRARIFDGIEGDVVPALGRVQDHAQLADHPMRPIGRVLSSSFSQIRCTSDTSNSSSVYSPHSRSKKCSTVVLIIFQGFWRQITRLAGWPPLFDNKGLKGFEASPQIQPKPLLFVARANQSQLAQPWRLFRLLARFRK
jgi:hypothetical protein